jgi:predicted  nucleic acid-binding Zn-ribbon protein
LRSLDAAKIEADFKSLYRNMLDGAQASAGALDAIAARLVTAGLRKEVLTQLVTELESHLSELKARQKVLAKKLGQRIESHDDSRR